MASTDDSSETPDEILARWAFTGSSAGPTEERAFVVRADVFGLVFPRGAPFTSGGLEFHPKRLPWYLRNWDRLESVHYATGKVRFRLVAPHWEEAIDLAHDGLLTQASYLLTFAQNRQVFFRNLSLEGRDHVFLYAGWGRVGIPARGDFRVLPNMTADFLSRAMSNLSAITPSARQRIFEAIGWINETTIASLAVDELKYTMLWLALETLAAGFTRRTPPDLLPEKGKDGLRSTLQHWADDSIKDAQVRARLLERVGRLTEPTTTERILAFAADNDLDLDVEKLSRVVRARNLVQHVPWRARAALEATYKELEAVVGRAVCRVLGLEPSVYLVPLNQSIEALVMRS